MLWYKGTVYYYVSNIPCSTKLSEYLIITVLHETSWMSVCSVRKHKPLWIHFISSQCKWKWLEKQQDKHQKGSGLTGDLFLFQFSQVLCFAYVHVTSKEMVRATHSGFTGNLAPPEWHIHPSQEGLLCLLTQSQKCRENTRRCAITWVELGWQNGINLVVGPVSAPLCEEEEEAQNCFQQATHVHVPNQTLRNSLYEGG